MTTFDHIISLGSDCDVSLQLRRQGWHHTQSVFDWLVTPWDSMMKVLQEDGARLAQDIYFSHDGIGAACGAYDLLYWHEFPHDDQGKVVCDRQAMGRAREKLTHKMAKMRAICSSESCILFIRSGICTDAPRDAYNCDSKTLFSLDNLDECAELISRKFPSLRFSLLFIEYQGRDLIRPALVKDPRITLYKMQPLDRREISSISKASDSEWDRLFSQIPYRPANLPTPGSMEETLF